MNQAYLLTGGNLGNRAENLLRAMELIGEKAGKVTLSSSVYETAAWGVDDQPDYLNQCLLVETQLEPEELLNCLLSIEKELGRVRQEKYGSRIIDLDILLYNDAVIATKKLAVPHPQMQNRRFVLEPMVEIAAWLVHPVLKKNMATLLKECIDPLNVKKISG